jgi:hypothetical protein
VIGFDDNPIARRMQPALTTVRQDAQGKGRAAAAALISAIAQAGARPARRGRHLLLPTELIVRDSTAPPPTARSVIIERRAKTHAQPRQTTGLAAVDASFKPTGRVAGR